MANKKSAALTPDQIDYFIDLVNKYSLEWIAGAIRQKEYGNAYRKRRQVRERLELRLAKSGRNLVEQPVTEGELDAYIKERLT
jgi:hypothetical protein